MKPSRRAYTNALDHTPAPESILCSLKLKHGCAFSIVTGVLRSTFRQSKASNFFLVATAQSTYLCCLFVSVNITILCRLTRRHAADFMAKGMMDKLDSLRALLPFVDADLFQHLVKIDADDMVFCHRWLLLSFKREFSFEDAIMLFEILCSHHLELSSLEAEKARDAETRNERERESGHADGGRGEITELNNPEINSEFTFELFVCVAILRKYREDLLKGTDVADIFTFINGLVCEMDLNQVNGAFSSLFSILKPCLLRYGTCINC